MQSDEDDLRDGLSGLAALVTGARTVNEILTEVAEFAAQAIPGVGGLGVTTIHPSDTKLQIQAWGSSVRVFPAIADRRSGDRLDQFLRP